ncbi:ketopantoate reductase family protein [Steroidobacter sp.]|uniref:ketopantoate reductase family protein n=1 Tax=Steroidobacter sp. TaxID=1978227 RepID=UPI001A56C6B5|nr:2-dehydropantoate 2-reductase [Steroidobacter sp.]MBL8270541.1 2-dehydropantoate 2-reductase [Steroidobacter sp.]
MASILIVGAGAVGALFGSALARQGAQVSVVCRSDYDVVSREGYDIISPLLGNHRFYPHEVFREVAECRTPPDFLLLTVKVLQGVDRAALIRPAIGPRTVIVLIQNGVDIEAEIAAAFPDNEILSGLALVGVGRSAPGMVNHQTMGQLHLGRYPEGHSEASERLAAMFNAGGIGCKLTDNVVTARWQKAVWNATFNTVSVTGGMLDTAVMLGTPESTAFIQQAMEEVCAVAAAAGHPMHPKLIGQLIGTTKSMPPYHTSMALDYKYGRPMEIEAILGNTVRAARKHGVSTPILDTLYALTKMIEQRIAAT